MDFNLIFIRCTCAAGYLSLDETKTTAPEHQTAPFIFSSSHYFWSSCSSFIFDICMNEYTFTQTTLNEWIQRKFRTVCVSCGSHLGDEKQVLNLYFNGRNEWLCGREQLNLSVIQLGTWTHVWRVVPDKPYWVISCLRSCILSVCFSHFNTTLHPLH